MSSLIRLHARLVELDDKLAVCMRCGMCQAVCPAYSATGLETSVARGKLAMLDGLAKELINDARGVRERLSMCLMCGSCEAACPSGVPVMDILFAARAALAEYDGLPRMKKLVFRLLLPHPRLMAWSLRWAARLQGLLLKPVKGSPGMVQPRPPGALLPRMLRGRRLPRLTRQPPHAHEPVSGVNKPAVLLFSGCVIPAMFPEVHEASLVVLRHAEAAVLLPPDQACCGIPALASGDERGFARLVARNMKSFADLNLEGIEALVTPCASCASTIRHLWPRAEAELAPRLREPMRRLAAKAMDMTEYLADKGFAIPDRGQARESRRVAFHDPCHLRKGLGVINEPRELLKALPGVEFTELPRPGACCGCGGSFTLDHPDESRSIGARRSRDIAASNADVVATACPACMMQLKDMLSRDGCPVPVKHVVELCLQAMQEQLPYAVD